MNAVIDMFNSIDSDFEIAKIELEKNNYRKTLSYDNCYNCKHSKCELSHLDCSLLTFHSTCTLKVKSNYICNKYIPMTTNIKNRS